MTREERLERALRDLVEAAEKLGTQTIRIFNRALAEARAALASPAPPGYERAYPVHNEHIVASPAPPTCLVSAPETVPNKFTAPPEPETVFMVAWGDAQRSFAEVERVVMETPFAEGTHTGAKQADMRRRIVERLRVLWTAPPAPPEGACVDGHHDVERCEHPVWQTSPPIPEGQPAPDRRSGAADCLPTPANPAPAPPQGVQGGGTSPHASAEGQPGEQSDGQVHLRQMRERLGGAVGQHASAQMPEPTLRGEPVATPPAPGAPRCSACHRALSPFAVAEGVCEGCPYPPSECTCSPLPGYVRPIDTSAERVDETPGRRHAPQEPPGSEPVTARNTASEPPRCECGHGQMSHAAIGTGECGVLCLVRTWGDCGCQKYRPAAAPSSQGGPEPLTVRAAARSKRPLDGPDAQALEGALALVERERDEARARLRAAEAERDGAEANGDRQRERAKTAERALAAAEKREAEMREAVILTKQGDCWCGVGVGVPYMRGHSDACAKLKALLESKP